MISDAVVLPGTDGDYFGSGFDAWTVATIPEPQTGVCVCVCVCDLIRHTDLWIRKDKTVNIADAMGHARQRTEAGGGLNVATVSARIRP